MQSALWPRETDVPLSGRLRGLGGDNELPFCSRVYVTLTCLLQQCFCFFTFQYLLTERFTGGHTVAGVQTTDKILSLLKGYN